ncbi:hypothetical protein WME79_03635 [Sorangium sp. So ce726]|uniref:hypothetical protein n=1 Tax=Sorangium sp. So ce726 TaxID=3133319 RepID=UPI003F63AD7B
MKDAAPPEASVKIVITNERDVPVYYPDFIKNPRWDACGGGDWRVDGQSLFSGNSAPPMCEGLLAGEPGLPACWPLPSALGPGETVELAWDLRAIERIPVVAACSTEPSEPDTTCGRYQLVEDGAHELSATFMVGYDENTLTAADSWSVTVPFELPTAVVNVIVE